MTDITQWLTPQEAAEEAGCSPSWITNLLNKGKLHGQRKGRTWLIHRDELQKLDGLRKRRAKLDVGQELENLRESVADLADVIQQLTMLVVEGNRGGRATQEMVSGIVEATGAQLAGQGTPDQGVDVEATAQSNADAAETQKQLV